jgi:hypothetical protein
MKQAVLVLLVGLVALAPAFADAQSSSSGKRPADATKSGSSGTTPSSGSSSGTTGSSSSPAASPSGSTADFSKYTTKADCEKAGGEWQAAGSKCKKKM